MTYVNVNSRQQLIGIEYTGNTPVMIFKGMNDEIYFQKLPRGVTRLDKVE